MNRKHFGCLGIIVNILRPTYTVGLVKNVVLLSILLCSGVVIGYSQISQSSEHSLYVGDTVSAEFYQISHKAIDLRTGKVSEMNLQPHRSKLIILDFWASWCMPCLGSLKHLHEIKGQLDTSKVLILPVTYQDTEDLSAIIERFKWAHQSIYADTSISALFPHPGLPHMVWIKDGEVIATPLATYATAENITNTTAGNMPQMFHNLDVKTLDYNVPINHNEDVKMQSFYKDEFLEIGGYIEKYAHVNLHKTETADSIFIHIVNMPLDGLFYQVYESKISPYRTEFHDALILDIDSNKQKMFLAGYPGYSSDADLTQDLKVQEWDSHNRYTLAFRIPKTYADSTFGDMIRSGVEKFADEHLGLNVMLSMSEPKRYPILKVVNEDTYNRVKHENVLPHRTEGTHMQYTKDKRSKITLLAGALMSKVKDEGLDYSDVTDRTDHDPDEPLLFEISLKMFEAEKLTMDEVNSFLKQYGLGVEIEEKGLSYLTLSSKQQ